ncbi:STAS domain-containing protein [Isoptericola croceus]|uniref:STAS domain-containing protein n=1 Tax=Isoptericola croceus TaxID=3031406 RepID=UPI0023F6D329|nr:STAS domain-containing protein [Isoptericola croceus]
MTVDDELKHGGVRIDPDRTHWVMWGEIDGAVQKRVEAELAEHLRQTAEEPLTVDLADVTFIDSGGLRLLYTAVEAKPTPPVLVGAPTRVRDLLRISGVERLFILED